MNSSNSGNETIETEFASLLSSEYRPCISCDDCRAIWYGPMEVIPGRGNQVVNEYCPHCGGTNVSEGKLPGAMLLNPGVDWPEDASWGVKNGSA